MIGQEWILAGTVFVATIFAVGAVVLLWEGVRLYRRQRSAQQALKRIHGDGAPESGGKPRKGDNLLRGEEGKPEGFVAIALNRLPHRVDIQQKLDQGGLTWGVGTFVLLSLGFSLAFGLSGSLITGSALLGAAFGGVGLFIPWFFVLRKRAQRIAAFEEQFPDALDLLTRSIRAGHAFNTGLKVVAEETEDPLRQEFRQVYEEQRFGLPIEESLLGLADRVDLVDVRLFVTSVLIQKEAGGNLAEKLNNLSTIIRARFKFRRQVKIHTAHGRMTGTVIGIAPFIATLGLYLVNKDYMEPLFTEPGGRIMIGVALFSMLLGYFAIRRITDIDY